MHPLQYVAALFADIYNMDQRSPELSIPFSSSMWQTPSIVSHSDIAHKTATTHADALQKSKDRIALTPGASQFVNAQARSYGTTANLTRQKQVIITPLVGYTTSDQLGMYSTEC